MTTAIITSIRVKPRLYLGEVYLSKTCISLFSIICTVRLDSISLIPRQLHPAVAAQVGVAEVASARPLVAVPKIRSSSLFTNPGGGGGGVVLCQAFVPVCGASPGHRGGRPVPRS